MWPFWDTTHYRTKSLCIDFDGNYMIIDNWHGQNKIWVQFWFVALQSHDFIGMSNHLKWDKIIPKQSWFFPVNARIKFISRNQVFEILTGKHCVKSVCIRIFSGPYFPAFGLNMGDTITPYSVPMLENNDQKNSKHGHFHAVKFFV